MFTFAKPSVLRETKMTFSGTSNRPSHRGGSPARSFGSTALVVILLSLALVVPASTFAQVVNVVHNYAGADAGDWGGAKGAVIGPPDDACANMGAKDKVNLVSNFGFSIPGTATITEVRAYTKAGASTVQTVDVQLASDATVDPPVTIGSVVDYPFPGVGSGNCANTIVSNVGNGLEFWGLVTLAPAVVNSSTFGMVFTKVETSEIKVDSICMQIEYFTEMFRSASASSAPMARSYPRRRRPLRVHRLYSR
jgi:hypothetical protein